MAEELGNVSRAYKVKELKKIKVSDSLGPKLLNIELGKKFINMSKTIDPLITEAAIKANLKANKVVGCLLSDAGIE